MKRTIWSLALGLSFILLFAAFANAQPMRMQGRLHPNGKMIGKADLMKKLNLTPEQKQKIGDLKIDFQKKMIDLKADLQKSKLDLRELRSKNDLNRDDILAAVEKINKNRDAISIAVANHMVDIFQILTPDQQKIARENAPRFLKMHKHASMMNRM